MRGCSRDRRSDNPSTGSVSCPLPWRLEPGPREAMRIRFEGSVLEIDDLVILIGWMRSRTVSTASSLVELDLQNAEQGAGPHSLHVAAIIEVARLARGALSLNAVPDWLTTVLDLYRLRSLLRPRCEPTRPVAA